MLSARIEQVIAPFAEQVALLDTIPGVDQRAAEFIVAEIGPDTCPGSRADVVSGTGSYVGSRASIITPGHHLRSKA